MARTSGVLRNRRRGWRGGNLLAILMIFIFAVSLFVLAPASAQTEGMGENPSSYKILIIKKLNRPISMSEALPNGAIWHTTDRATWTTVPGQLNRLAGDD